MEKKTIAYIAHPVGGDVKGNIKKILQIVRSINLSEPSVIPFVPYMSDIMAMNDDQPEERKRGLSNDFYIIQSGIVDELRLYGSGISKGMAQEIFHAFSAQVPIKAMTDGTRLDFLGQNFLNKTL
jgi:hypothetical protein